MCHKFRTIEALHFLGFAFFVGLVALEFLRSERKADGRIGRAAAA